jgi:1,4-dihydroxy-2-naphthoate octaprenyltransferase
MSSKDYVSVLTRQSAPEGVDWRTMSVVARALLLTRASVLPLTILGSGQGLLFAWWSGKISDATFGGSAVSGILLGFAAFFGANLAHAANNLANDWRDYHDGLDRPGYPRADYSPHPIASGAMSSRTLLVTIGVLTAFAAILGGFTMVIRGEPLLGAFAIAGLILSWGYTDPPLRLKRRGLGELSAFIVWGPLMGGGTYLAATGTLDATALIATLPWALFVTAVLFGKHLDKIEADGSRGVKTFVVRIGERRARAFTTLLITAGYLGIAVFAIPAIGIFPWFVAPLAGLGALVALPALKIVAAPRPAAPPAGYPLWPLWHVGAAFLASRPAMLALFFGLAVGAILDR